jgi:hypothetical protein
MGLLAWFQRQRQWHRDHVAAFSVVTQKQPDGLTLFQHQAISAMAQFVAAERFKRIPAQKGGGDYLVGPLGTDGAELYVYPNEAMIFGAKPHVWFEEWDYTTPEDLLQSLVRECAFRAAK